MNKWISVNDRLPYNSNVVLAYDLRVSRGINVPKIYFAFYLGTTWFHAVPPLRIMDVTHWMRLPNPPEEESEPIGNTEQLPVAWIKKEYSPDCGYFFNIYEHEIDGYMPVYTHPIRELSDKEILEVWKENYGDVNISNFARAILKKASEK